MMPLLSGILPSGLLPAAAATFLIFAGAFFLHQWVVRHHPGWEYLIFAQKRKKAATAGREEEMCVAGTGSLRSGPINETRL